jgi:hypothetical protein
MLDRIGVHREITLAILLPGVLLTGFGIWMLVIEELGGQIVGGVALALGLLYLGITMLLWRRNSKLTRELDAGDEPVEPEERMAA